MAEIVYKKISELDTGTVPLDGGELIMVSQTGVSKKATISQAHGAGWWNVLKVALSSFVAPEATHSADSDTCGEESPSDFHDAAQLTGNIHLDRIPAELTGKNAATATLATNANTSVYASSNLVAGGIGSYAFCFCAVRPIAFGATVVGSNLQPVGVAASDLESTSALTGTWRCMGYIPTTPDNWATLFVRIS